MIATKSPKEVIKIIAGLSNKTLIQIILTLLAIDIFLTMANIYINKVTIYHIDGTPTDYRDIQLPLSILKTLLFTFPLLVFIISLFVAASFKKKQVSFSKRILNTFLKGLVYLYGSMILISIIALTLVGFKNKFHNF